MREGDLVEVLLEGDRIIIVPHRKRRITFRAGFKFTVEDLEEEAKRALDELN